MPRSSQDTSTRKAQTYGYARVSTREQNVARQLDALQDVGIAASNIYVDHRSGKDFDRPAWRRLQRRLRPGDVLVVKSIDRLGRNYEEIISVWQGLTHVRGVSMVVLDMPLLDTREERGGITGEFVADMVLQVLSYVAQVERENIKTRQAEGIAAAKARGVKFGRDPLPIPDGFGEQLVRWRRGEVSARRAARELGVSPPTFAKWAKAESTN
jgi:DNA invertase Pin-like site-specific DNA recombinase